MHRSRRTAVDAGYGGADIWLHNSHRILIAGAGHGWQISGGAGTNPEQLFAAGWWACFIGAIGLAARGRKVTLPADPAVDAEVDLRNGDGGYFLEARLNVSLPGLDRETARELVETAHQTCPYSKATRGNIEVEINLV